MILLISFCVIYFKFDVLLAECTDIYGRSITPNTHFIPGPDICQLCVCDNTQPKWCKRVLCSPPQNCKSFVMGNSCCDYSCLDNTLPSGEFREEIDRRFLITIATAFLLLTVLLFIIHKLRHRTIHGRLQNRQLNEDRRSIGSIGFITGSIGYLNLPNGHHFDDHPLVHFPIYKPNASYFPRGEAPPPYEEAMADNTLNVTYASQLLSNDRVSQEMNQQRRRSNSAGLTNSIAQSRMVSCENCLSEPHQQSAETLNSADVTSIYNCTLQHRSIPLSICANVDNTNQANPACKNEMHEHGSRTNNTNQNRVSLSNSKRNMCPSQLHFESLSTGIRCSSQHRTLPLSASLSSPLPSTSDSCDRQSQFATFSSAVNISSSDGDEPTSEPLVKITCPNPAVTISIDKESSTNKQKESKSTTKETKDRSIVLGVTDGTDKNSEQDNYETNTSQLVDDYHAECENCNLNVNTGDATDEYFLEQETMTLQRKLHEISAIKCNDQAMKVSLTLPTNSRSHRCSSKNQKCGRWDTKQSPFKNKLENVSSKDEDTES